MAVDLKLAGGSLPASASLDWLVEKGYRTLLDLRESSEISPSFIAEVTKRGLRCVVANRLASGSIDREHVDRFAFEVAAREARPMYFFDSDGTRQAPSGTSGGSRPTASTSTSPAKKPRSWASRIKLTGRP